MWHQSLCCVRLSRSHRQAPSSGSGGKSSGSGLADKPGDRDRTQDFVIDLDNEIDDEQSGADEDKFDDPEEQVDKRFEKNKNWEIRIRRANGSIPTRRDGRLTGPVGKDTKVSSQQSFHELWFSPITQMHEVEQTAKVRYCTFN